MKKRMMLVLSVAGLSLLADPAQGVMVALELPPGPDNPRNSEGAFMPPMRRPTSRRAIRPNSVSTFLQ